MTDADSVLDVDLEGDTRSRGFVKLAGDCSLFHYIPCHMFLCQHQDDIDHAVDTQTQEGLGRVDALPPRRNRYGRRGDRHW